MYTYVQGWIAFAKLINIEWDIPSDIVQIEFPKMMIMNTKRMAVINIRYSRRGTYVQRM